MIPFEYSYKLYKDKVVYTPVAGPTIREAISSAFELRAYFNLPVVALLNDITLNINDKSKFELVVEEYYKKLNEKYKKQDHEYNR